MSNSISNPNAKTSTLDATTELRKNMNYLEKFGLSPSIAKHINFQLIFNDIYINNPIIASDIELNSYILYYLEIYQFSQSLVVNYMLEIFHEKFHRWKYIKFSKLEKYIR